MIDMISWRSSSLDATSGLLTNSLSTDGAPFGARYHRFVLRNRDRRNWTEE
ncbi:hypothetical protein [Ensifer soli]|uniref:hypothetical protein n=1 Tax=Ciceribacter sp. sgz301302 TaxID=3342379 RepID=UPI0035B99D07